MQYVNSNEEIKAAYIHIPFCDKICSYCDFCKVLYNRQLVDKYLDSLEEEIKSNYLGEVINTIYIGGGTPSSLSVLQLERLFKIVSIFKKREDIEFTIEANFESTSEEKIDLFKKYGVNRISFGLESTNKKHLDFLNRDFDRGYVVRIINYAKSIGIDNINIDLIYALKSQTIEELKEDLDFIISLDIKHISTYSLIIEENTLLGVLGVKNISEDMDLEMYKFICKYLRDNGFKHYEISNFCKDGYYSRHNTVYWKNLEYYGFGLGASSYIGSKRITNTRSFNKYFSKKYILSIEEVSNTDLMEYEIMLGLRLSDGIDKKKFRNRFGKRIDECYNYNELIDNGFIIDDGDNLFIPEDKFYVSNEIIVKFIEGEKYE